VQFGALIEGTRAALTDQGRLEAPVAVSRGLGVLRHHRLLLAGSSLLAIAQRLRLVPAALVKKAGLPSSTPIRRNRLRADDQPVDAILFTGCVMDVWQRPVHEATLRVMRATGSSVGLPGSGSSCCGALHAHAGRHDDARVLAQRVINDLGGATGPAIVVNSAGCGAALKDYGRLIGTDEASGFSARVEDIGEWLAPRAEQLPPSHGTPRPVVAISDPCHLRHVQRAHLPIRAALARYVDVRELDDDGRCCGAGGSYQLSEPELAETIRAQKIASIGRSGAPVVVSGNPGCTMWLGQGGVNARHPIEIIDEAIAPVGVAAQPRKAKRNRYGI
jgi:glycolate oxidase iron-sulfur subunit